MISNSPLKSEVIDASALPQYVGGPRAPGWWGIFFLVVIELTVFGSLISSYFYLLSGSLEWPPDGIKPSELFLPTVNSLLLVASVLPMWWAVRVIRKGDQRQLKIAMAIAFVMGVTFLVLKFVEYSDKPFTWATNAYGSIVWTMIGFHTLHVIAALLKTASVWVVAYQGFFDERRHVAVETNSIYWYFVAGIWVPLYFIIYWSPRWF